MLRRVSGRELVERMRGFLAIVRLPLTDPILLFLLTFTSHTKGPPGYAARRLRQWLDFDPSILGRSLAPRKHAAHARKAGLIGPVR